MAEPGALDYFYGTEAEQYTFYRIPKVLFTDPGFRRITADAKILYGLMLDRMGLSIRNNWLDEQERVFIYFTLEEAMDAMCCGHNKAVSLFTELDKVGLIERKKQGQGRPTKIYVKNFIRKEEVKTSENRKSALPESGTLDFRKSDTINTNKNKTDLSANAGVHQVILSHIEEHSKKPEEARSRIVRLMGDVPRIELFARGRAPGWDVWGNEAAGSIQGWPPRENLREVS